MQVQIKPSGKIGREGYVTTASEKTFARTFAGQGADGDIVVASTRAYVAALNKMIHFLVSSQPGSSPKVATGAAENGTNSSAPTGSASEEAVPAA